MKLELWDEYDPLYYPYEGEPIPYSQVDDGWGICNTESGIDRICEKGGIGCDVDHLKVKIRNLEKKIVDMAERVDALA